MSVRIVLADDHEIVRQGVRRILETHADWEICAEAENGQKAVRLAEQLNPDAIIMDVSMPVMSGLEATREISSLNANIRILIFTMHESPAIADSARKVGARGLVTKSEASRDLIRALERLLSGGTFFPTGENCIIT
jgi:DNA-binding NarL/FixJ family response regulator